MRPLPMKETVKQCISIRDSLDVDHDLGVKTGSKP